MSLQKAPSHRPDGSIQKILVVLNLGLPEAILAGCLLHGLRARHPHAKIIALAPASQLGAVKSHPSIDGVIAIPENAEMALAIPIWEEIAVRQLINSIRPEKFDMALAPSPTRNALVDMAILASDAPERIGWKAAVNRGEDEIDADGWDGFYTHLVDLLDAPHAEPDRYRHFVLALGMDPGEERLSWPVSKEACRSTARRLGATGGPKTSTWLALWCGPGDSTGFHAWGEALRPILHANPTMGVILLGTGGRGALAEDATRWGKSRCLDLRGSLAAPEALEMLSLCRVVVGEEGPWVSLCAARQVPHVVLVGGGAFGRYAPVSPWATAVCHPLACYFCDWACDQGGHHCLGGIPPEAVMEGVRHALASSGTKPRLLVSLADPGLGIPPLDLEPLLNPDAYEQVLWQPTKP